MLSLPAIPKAILHTLSVEGGWVYKKKECPFTLGHPLLLFTIVYITTL